MKDMIVYKTKYPFNVYFIFFCLIVQAYFMRDLSIGQTSFYLVLSFLFLYCLFSRYASRIEIYKDYVYIRYFFFWDKNITILFEDLCDTDFEKGFYDFTTDKSLGNGFAFPKYCYDEIIFKTKTSEIVVNINTRTFMFNKAYSLIATKIADKKSEV